MFESNQSIMLMGAAATVDIAAHLANANSNIESESNDAINDNSVNFPIKYEICLFNSVVVFRDGIKEFRKHLLC